MQSTAPTSGSATPCPVVVITDVRLYREGLAQLLASSTAIEVLGTWSPTDQMVGWQTESRPCVVVMDSASARRPGLIAQLSTIIPRAKVVAFAVAEEDEDEIIGCAELGVTGFVARDASAEELIAVILGAACGNALCSPRVTAVVLRRVAHLRALHPGRSIPSQLTPREEEIVALIGTGLPNKLIARRLGLQPNTVKNHVHNILDKLQVQRRSEAAALMRMRVRIASADGAIGRQQT